MDGQTPTQPRHGLLARPPQRLHHYAFVIRDHEVNRHFVEDILGIPLVATWCERANFGGLGREIDYCHTFFALADGGALAFFQFADDEAYEQFRAIEPERGHHIAFKVSSDTYDEIRGRLIAEDIPRRETDHGYCKSLYVSSPDGIRLEFTVDPPEADEIATIRRADCHSELERWLAGDRRPNNDIRHGTKA